MQKIAAERGQLHFADAQVGGGSVEGVADDGVLERGKMDANLMGAAGVELHLEQRGGVEAEKRAPVGAGFARIGDFYAVPGFLFGGHAHTADGVAADGELDAAVILFEVALYEGDVG